MRTDDRRRTKTGSDPETGNYRDCTESGRDESDHECRTQASSQGIEEPKIVLEKYRATEKRPGKVQSNRKETRKSTEETK
jgi:hypothetical protein